jgi:hypothetical protein
MATDIFTGGPSGSPIAWSVTGAWSTGLPTSTSVVEETGAGILDNEPVTAGGLTIAGLVLDSGSSLTVGDFLTVTGLGDATFGGANSTLTITNGITTIGPSVTAAAGTVNIVSDGDYVYQGSGADQTVNTSGEFFLTGSHNDDTITINSGINADMGSDNGGTVYLHTGGLWDEFGTNDTTTIDMAGGGLFGDGAQFSGLIDNFGANGQIAVEDASWTASGGVQVNGTPSSYSVDAATQTITFDFTTSTGVEVQTLHFGTGTNVADLTVGMSGNVFGVISSTPVCFCAGTLIRTSRGDVAVEDLEVGDLAVTASGEALAIAWIGHRRIEGPSREQWPVQVRAGAFADGLPERDLFLSPGHAVCVDVVGEVFVPVDHLINGVTIFRKEVAAVTYWHVELQSHDVLLAEGLPCESYMDCGNRAWFGREYGRLAEVDPARVAESLTRYARPFVDHGPIVEAICERLAVRAKAILAESESAGIGPDCEAA